MATTVDTVLGVIKTDLAAVTTAGGYHNNLNGSDQVLIGSYIESAREGLASVQIADWQVTSSYDAQLTGFRRTLSVTLIGRVPADDDSPGSRSTAAARLLDDVMTALETDYSLGGNVLSLLISDSGPIDGMQGDVGRTGAFACIVQCYWLPDRAVGI